MRAIASSFDRTKRLRIINQELRGRTVSGGKMAFSRPLTRRPPLPHCDLHERLPRHLLHLPRDYELAIRWLRPSFISHREHWTPGRQGWVFHGTAPVRYVDAGQAALCAARSQERAHVCLRADGL